MANSCNILHQKQGVGRGYLKIYSTKTYQIMFEIGGSNQTGRIWCISRENAQSRVHVAQAHHQNSVFQSAGGNPNTKNTLLMEGGKNKKQESGDRACHPADFLMLAEIKNFTTDEINHGYRDY